MRAALMLIAMLGLALAQSPFQSRFEQGWKLVKERYYDTSYRGLNWDEVGDRYRARLSDSVSHNYATQ